MEIQISLSEKVRRLGGPWLQVVTNSNGGTQIMNMDRITAIVKSRDGGQYCLYFDLDAKDGGYVFGFKTEADRDTVLASVISELEDMYASSN